MQPEIEEIVAELEAYDTQENHPRIFELYEEYSQRPIADTIRIRRERFGNADLKVEGELLIEVEREITDFRAWMEETKNLEHITAHYYSVSLKSLLLGLPIGVQVTRLFDTVLETQAKK
ncbi:hypothetical protein E3J49_00135 [Candidatus Bathyarchaeota archaeon]|nr:MAG: hypothetical protein E3J49_00135 [Candidatus Bathyarchaeota archaeon]